MPSFEQLVGSMGAAACREWGYPDLPSTWMPAVLSRLPPGLRQALADAIEGEIIRVVSGHRFTLSGLAPGKGPYAFFSRSSKRVPAPNWEYFVQAAEYGRIVRAVGRSDLRVSFEDDLMDISVSAGDRVLWCIEVKEKGRDLDPLLSGLRRVGVKADLTSPDRHNDPLRKSKYLLRHQPPYFSLVAVGRRLDFSVIYRAHGFDLTEDLVPLA